MKDTEDPDDGVVVVNPPEHMTNSVNSIDDLSLLIDNERSAIFKIISLDLDHDDSTSNDEGSLNLFPNCSISSPESDLAGDFQYSTSSQSSNSVHWKNDSLEEFDHSIQEEEEEEGGEATDDEGTTNENSTKRCFHSSWCSYGVTWSNAAGCVVRNAPCFWFRKKLVVGATDRSILLRLNVLCLFFAVGQIFSAVCLAILLYAKGIVDRDNGKVNRDEKSFFTFNVWNITPGLLSLGLVALIISISVIRATPGIQEVNLSGSIRFLRSLVWILPIEAFFVIEMFDFHRVSDVWVRHWWSIPSMAWFRWLFCANGTYNTECMVPIIINSNSSSSRSSFYYSEEEWCVSLYNSTNCSVIRDDAQRAMMLWSHRYFVLNGVWGLFLLVLLLMSLNVLEGIITKPIVQSAREANIPLWLALPTITCTTLGAVLVFSPSSVVGGPGISWIGIFYFACGAAFFLGSLLSWYIATFRILNSRDKTNKSIAVLLFVIIMVVTACLVAAIFVVSIIYGVTFIVRLKISDNERGILACTIDTVQSCSSCYNRTDSPKCPEWTTAEVIKVMQSQLKQSASLAVIVFLYSMGSIRFGFMLRKHISSYQIDYV